MAARTSGGASIDKFDILATYTYAKALLDGHDDDQAKQRAMVAAIMGANARLGTRGEHLDDFSSLKDSAERKKKTTITAHSFDNQVALKMGRFFDEVFLPVLRTFANSGLTYEDIKNIVKIPTFWGEGHWRAVQGTGGGSLQDTGNGPRHASMRGQPYQWSPSCIGGSSIIALLGSQ